MPDEMDCSIYADLDQAKLSDALRKILSEKDRRGNFHWCDNEIVTQKNLSFDPILRREFPDGFVYFHAVLEIFPEKSKAVSLENQIELVSKILKYFWLQGIPAVATCDYEDQLPNNGGYKSTDVPWVTSDH